MQANPLLYFNTAGCGLVSEEATTAGENLYKKFSTNSSTAAEHWRDVEAAKIKNNIAQFMGAKAAQIALVPNFSYGINSLVQSLKGSERILLYQNDYPSLTAPFTINNFTIEWLNDLDGFLIDLNEIETIFKTKNIDLFAISHVQWTTGFKIDLKKLSNLCQEYHVTLLVDGTQSLGALEIDLSQLKIDVFILSNYKWMNAGFGTGIMYISEDFLEKFPPVVGGFSSYPLQNGKVQRKVSMLDYEPGHTNMFGYTILDKAIEEKNKIGLNNIATHNKSLIQLLIDELNNLPVVINGEASVENRSAILFLKDENELGSFLKHRNVIVTPRFGNLRVSFHYYNTVEEVNLLVQYLKEWSNKK